MSPQDDRLPLPPLLQRGPPRRAFLLGPMEHRGARAENSVVGRFACPVGLPVMCLVAWKAGAALEKA